MDYKHYLKDTGWKEIVLLLNNDYPRVILNNEYCMSAYIDTSNPL